MAAKKSSKKNSSKKQSVSRVGEGILRVGLLGLGTVGSGVAEILMRHADLIAQRTGMRLKIVRAFVRNARKKRSGAAGHVPLTTDPLKVVAGNDIDIVVELLGGIEPAYSLMMSALRNGKAVVTANKAVVALHGSELFRAAELASTDVYFEGAVAGGVPIIRTLREGLAADRITQVCGILNGTTNFILSKMREGQSYDEALREAQRLGFAEADPTLDVNGRDAADKLAILTQLAFGTHVTAKDIPTDGITELTPQVLADAEQLGYRIKLVAMARRVAPAGSKKEKLEVGVHPSMVPVGSALSSVPDSQNAIAIRSDALGATLYQGAGAGSLPTGSAVVGDLIEAARNMKAGVHGRILGFRAGEAALPILPPDDTVSAYYLRLLVADKPGVLASIAKVLANHKISMASVLQRDRGVSPVPLVITTHPTTHGAMQKALNDIAKLGVAHAGPSLIRIRTE